MTVAMTMTTPMTIPDFNAINSLTPEQRLPAITTNPANTNDNGVTKSTNADDSISATDNDGNLMFHVVNGERESVMVDNSNADWTANPPSLSTSIDIFDDTSFASKTLANYNDGDFYAVTGFWYRSPTDFGVFVDGSPIDLNTNPLPTTGNARYRGNIGGQYWGDEAGVENTGAPNISGNFIGNINLQVNISTLNPNYTFLTGQINIAADDNFSTAIDLSISEVRDNNRDGVFDNSDNSGIICSGGCGNFTFPNSHEVVARFVGDPVTNAAGDGNSDGWPAGIIGAFSLQDLPVGDSEVDMLGFFSAIHEDLCLATASGGSAAFCTK